MTDTNASENERPRLDAPVPAAPDRSWARQQPIQMIPSAARLSKPYSVVDVTNKDLHGQKHVVIDRNMVGHELQPGQTLKDVEMLNVHIEHFQRQSRSGRFGPQRYGPGGVLLARDEMPAHPIKILNVRDAKEAEEQRLAADKAKAKKEAEKRVADAKAAKGEYDDDADDGKDSDTPAPRARGKGKKTS